MSILTGEEVAGWEGTAREAESWENKFSSTTFYDFRCESGRWWHTPLIPALGRQRLADLCEFEVSLVYRGSYRTAQKKSNS